MMMQGHQKHIATISLGVMAAGFAATFPVAGTAWGGLLQGGFEAGLVGGLADWFAVTALFRHPLGLPIPHTSLLTRNREKLTKALVSAVENELLNPQSIADKLKQIRVAERALERARSEIGSDSGKRAITAISEYMANHLPYEAIADYAAKEAETLFRSLDASPLYTRLTEEALTRGWDEKALDYVLDKAEAWVIKLETRDMLGAMALQALGNIQLGGFMGFAMGAISGYMTEDKLGSIVQSLLLSAMRDLRRKGGPRRESLLSEIRDQVRESRNHPGLLESLDAIKATLLRELAPERRLREFVTALKQKLIDFVRDPRFADEYAVPFLTRLIDQVRTNEHMLQQAEDWIQRRLLALVEQHHRKIGELVKENVDKLDNDTLISMLEDKVGKDLQWIRVNGALCGFLIGIGLSVVKMLV